MSVGMLAAAALTKKPATVAGSGTVFWLKWSENTRDSGRNDFELAPRQDANAPVPW